MRGQFGEGEGNPLISILLLATVWLMFTSSGVLKKNLRVTYKGPWSLDGRLQGPLPRVCWPQIASLSLCAPFLYVMHLRKHLFFSLEHRCLSL